MKTIEDYSADSYTVIVDAILSVAAIVHCTVRRLRDGEIFRDWPARFVRYDELSKHAWAYRAIRY
jgi:F0F1-type ATP synthase alpha subunit